MEQEKAGPIGYRSMLPVETSDSLDRCAQKLLVVGCAFGGRVRPVRKQSKTDFVIRAGEIMDFQPLDQFIDRSACREQRWHDDDGSELERNTIAKLKPGEHSRADPLGDRA